MPSSYSTALRLELIATGEQSGSWGTTTNTNLGTLLEQAIAGVASITMTDANYTLTSSNGASDQARNAAFIMTGTLTASRNVVVPTSTKLYIVKNGTTGGFSIVVKTSAGTGVTVLNGKHAIVYCDGTNVVDVSGNIGALIGANNLSDVASAATARTNLGLGTAATLASTAVAQTANNLSDLASAATARTNLGLAIGTDVQAYDATTMKTGAVQTMTKALRGTPVALTSSSASIATDASAGNFFTHTFTENTTLANPSNLAAGQEGIIVFTQHSSSPKTLAFGSYWKFSGGTVPSVTATNSAVDVLVYYVESSTRITAKLLTDVK